MNLGYAAPQTTKGQITFYDAKSLNQRMAVIAKAVEIGIKDPWVHKFVGELLRRCPARDDRCEVNQLFWFFKGNVRYTADMMGMGNQPIDFYSTLKQTLAKGTGDCDDATIAIVTAAKVAGFATGARVVSKTGATWDHIYALLGVPKLEPTWWLPLDITVPSAVPGWEPPFVKTPRAGVVVKRQDYTI